MLIEAPAKINLCLYVLGRRPDGYHEIFSLMQAVSLYDEIEILPAEKFSLTVEGAQIEGENLIEKAHRVLCERVGRGLPVRVRLRKNIPIGAGLGGGSSDAAAFLAAVNRVFSLGLGRDELMRLGAQVGSDVPFFFSGGSAAVFGRGENVVPVRLPRDYWVVLIVPNFSVNTGWAYSRIRNYLTPPQRITNLLYLEDVASVFDFLDDCRNSFEAVIREAYPEVNALFGALEDAGAEKVLLSGSGSALFGVFRKRERAQRAYDDIGGKAFGGSVEVAKKFLVLPVDIGF